MREGDGMQLEGALSYWASEALRLVARLHHHQEEECLRHPAYSGNMNTWISS